MPGLDRSGPEGRGPRTGRGLGNCNNTNESNYFNNSRPRFGLRRNRGINRGYGYRAQSRNYNQEPTNLNPTNFNSRKEQLKQELQDLELDKKEIQKELEELEKE